MIIYPIESAWTNPLRATRNYGVTGGPFWHSSPADGRRIHLIAEGADNVRLGERAIGGESIDLLTEDGKIWDRLSHTLFQTVKVFHLAK